MPPPADAEPRPVSVPNSLLPRPTSRLILDLMTPAEVLVRIPTILGGVALVFILLAVLETKVALDTALLVLLAGALCVKGGLAMTRSTDCYFVVDGGMRQVLYHQKILGYTRLVRVAAFEDVLRLELVSRVARRSISEERPRAYPYRIYEMYLVDRHGGRHRVSDPANSDEQGTGLSLRTLECRGWSAAGMIGCPFIWREPRRWGLFLFLFALAAVVLAIVVVVGVFLPQALTTLLGITAAFGAGGLVVWKLLDWIAPGELPEQAEPSERLRQAGGPEAAKRLPPRRG